MRSSIMLCIQIPRITLNEGTGNMHLEKMRGDGDTNLDNSIVKFCQNIGLISRQKLEEGAKQVLLFKKRDIREREILYGIHYMWSLKRNDTLCICSTALGGLGEEEEGKLHGNLQHHM